MTKEEMQAIAEIANALQVASPLSTALRQGLGDAAQHALDLEAALDRAVSVMRQMQPNDRKGGAQ